MKPILVRVVRRQPKSGRMKRAKKGMIFLPPRLVGKKVRVITY